MASIRERARGALLGLAVGDALGAPAENLKPSEIRARWGRVTGFVAAEPAGTDDTEYAIFSGLLLARHGSALTPADVEAAWHEWIADRAEGPFKGAGFSERGTLENLRRGLAAPISAQHRHAWSDGLAMRAAVSGVHAAGRPAEAARLAAIDGSVSHDGEGIYGGQAVAAGVAAAMGGASPEAVVAAALTVVPDDSWTARSLRRAVTAAHGGERAVRSAVVIGGYPWTDLAPEAVALAFGAYAAADGEFRDAVLTAVNMGRDADTTAAVAGALAGATQGVAAIPADWASAIGPARGSCLPAMKGRHVLEVADLLVAGRDVAGREVAGRDAAEPAASGTDATRILVPDFVPDTLEGPAVPVPDIRQEPTAPVPDTREVPTIPAAATWEAPTASVPDTPVEPTMPAAATWEAPTAPMAATSEEPTASLPGTLEEPSAPLPGTLEEPSAPLPDPVEESTAPVPDTREEPPTPAGQPVEAGGGWAPAARGVRAPGPLVPAVDPGDDGNEARS